MPDPAKPCLLLNSELPAQDVRELAADLAHILQQKHWFLATAESCTGGLISATCTDLAGSSLWFERGFVVYSNASKSELLGVDAALIERVGAVSEDVARAMALGALRHSRAQVAVAVTGVAGPSGGSADKPVGTVCFGWATPSGVDSETRCFAGDRQAVRQATVRHALAGLVARCSALQRDSLH
jgi:nicotinamide-nucleotide amidase